MAEATEIKARIQSVSDTKKVTDAMYMISSVKLRRAKREVEKTTPYFEALKDEIDELSSHIPKNDSRYFKSDKTDCEVKPKHGVLVITSDKGLSGGYNRAVTNVVDDVMKTDPDTLLFVIGEYGKQYLTDRGIPFAGEFSYPAELADIKTARRICTELLEYYNDGRLDKISIIYTDYRSDRPNECRKLCLLPLEGNGNSEEKEPYNNISDVEFVPSPAMVLDGIVPNYLTGFIYGSLIDSYCSEQEARMTMMNTAGKNADEMIRKLRLRYNSIRQAAITREMTEITAGARALRSKKSGQKVVR